MPFTFNFEDNINSPDIFKYRFIKPDGSFLSWREFIIFLLKNDEDFLKVFRESLNHATEKLEAYFWECIPVSNTTEKVFEFSVTKSHALKESSQNFGKFKGILEIAFKNFQAVASFPNPSQDTVLVIPALEKDERNEIKDFKNISEFTKNASFTLQNTFWSSVARDIIDELGKDSKSEKTVWVSTHGLGVSYLHVRIANWPKYYSCEEYKTNQKTLPTKNEKETSQTIPKNLIDPKNSPLNDDQNTPTVTNSWLKNSKTWAGLILLLLLSLIFSGAWLVKRKKARKTK
jgi:hypothetical protein